VRLAEGVEVDVGCERQLEGLGGRELGGLEVGPRQQPPVGQAVELDLLAAEQSGRRECFS
jgi:hypothetical protein